MNGLSLKAYEEAEELLHLALQYLTFFQSLSHFFLHLKGFLQ